MTKTINTNQWKKIKLGDVCNVQTGPFGSQLHQKDYVLDGTPIITVEHLGCRKISRQKLPCVSDEDVTRLNKYTLIEGDVVFSRVGSVDRASYVMKEEEGWLFSGRCLRIRPIDQNVNSMFLYYYFCQDQFKEYVRKISVGATMPSLNTKILSDIIVSIPPLPIQRRIGEILGSFDAKIELNRRMNTTLEQIATALFKSWFV
ncbi:MAG: restriction endonuclease subunit S, partial [Planctomycetaceae bacterium]|nr:restriction endonuclease subunit S [Planctomycetaceae bacterium]